jgi:hypothetical protein
MKNFTFGCDPEFVAYRDGLPVSALKIIDARKETPTNLSKGGLLADNVNIEVNTVPTDSFDEFVTVFRSVIDESEHITNAELHAISSLDYPEDQLDDPEALAFGCNPDYNAHSLSIQYPATEAALSSFRTTGGHIHIGVNDSEHEYLYDDMGKVYAVRAMDAVVGLILVALDIDPTSPKRRELYGLAGSHRPTEYGVEYRAPSSFWTRNPLLAQIAFELTQTAAKLASDRDLIDSMINKIDANVLQDAINTSNRALCQNIFYNEIASYVNPETIELINLAEKNDFGYTRILPAWS